MWQNEIFECHRRHPVLLCKTIEIYRRDHFLYLRDNNDQIAKRIGLKHRENQIFEVKKGRDPESAMQALEKTLADYDEAQHG